MKQVEFIRNSMSPDQDTAVSDVTSIFKKNYHSILIHTDSVLLFAFDLFFQLPTIDLFESRSSMRHTRFIFNKVSFENNLSCLVEFAD